jgi:hypothetical protein
MEELWCHKVQREAGEKLDALMAMPLPSSIYESDAESFDPWSLFPLYGSYSGEFDECALDVLRELRDGQKERRDLAAEMFREMLCNLELCDYGTSPRVCFPTPEFRERLPRFIEMWEAYSAAQWSETGS